MKSHSKALVFFAVSKQIPVVYPADRDRAEINWADSWEKGPKSLAIWDPSNTHVQPVSSVRDVALRLKLPLVPYILYCVLTDLSEPSLFAYVISTLFS